MNTVEDAMLPACRPNELRGERILKMKRLELALNVAQGVLAGIISDPVSWGVGIDGWCPVLLSPPGVVEFQ